MTDETPRYANGQPVGYSNRNLCPKCAGDLGDCNCPPPADASVLRIAANVLDEHWPRSSEYPFIVDPLAREAVVTTAARLRALASVLDVTGIDAQRWSTVWRVWNAGDREAFIRAFAIEASKYESTLEARHS